jgi:hypothetical protein
MEVVECAATVLKPQRTRRVQRSKNALAISQGCLFLRLLRKELIHSLGICAENGPAIRLERWGK